VKRGVKALLEVGRVIDRYVVAGPLGKGGMAQVYLVRHTQLDTLHALKVVSTPTVEASQRLLREGRAMGKIRHSGIVAVTDYIDVDGLPGLVMEYVNGPTLYQILREHRLSFAQADFIGRGILAAVAAAHHKGLVHRDLKPANVLFQVDEDEVVVKVADFGLVKLLESEDMVGYVTRTGSTFGSPAYMAPEQIEHTSNVDTRADIFALGAILFELVTGERAFSGAEIVEVFHRILQGEYASANEYVPDVPSAMEQAIASSMKLNPELRAADCEAVLAKWVGDRPAPSSEVMLPLVGPMVKEHTAPLASAPTYHIVEKGGDVARPPRRPFLWLALGGLVSVALVLLTVFVVTQTSTPSRYFAVDGAPVVFDDVVLQRQLEAAWSHFLETEMDLVVRDLEVVLEGHPNNPEATLLLAESQFFRGENRICLGVLSDWIDMGEDGAAASMLRLKKRALWKQEVESGVKEHFELYPNDFLGFISSSTMHADLTYGAFDIDPEPLKQALQLDAEAATVHYLLGQEASNDENPTLARETFKTGLLHHPSSALLLLGLAQNYELEGNFDLAKETGLYVVQMAPEMDQAHMVILGVDLMLGNEADYQQRLRLRLDSAHPLERRVAFLGEAMNSAAAKGRIEVVDRYFEDIAGQALAEQQFEMVLYLAYQRSQRNFLLHNLAGLQADAEWAQRSLNNPETPPKMAHEFLVSGLKRQTLIAAMQGEVESAQQGIERLVSMEENVLLLTVMVDVARSDAGAVQKHELPFPGCVSNLIKGRNLLAVGEVTLAEKHLTDTIMASPPQCLPVGFHAACQVMAYVYLAKIALIKENHELAKVHLGVFRNQWPHADPDLPVMALAREIEQQLGQ
jgi:hypothetical protein